MIKGNWSLQTYRVCANCNLHTHFDTGDSLYEKDIVKKDICINCAHFGHFYYLVLKEREVTVSHLLSFIYGKWEKQYILFKRTQLLGHPRVTEYVTNNFYKPMLIRGKPSINYW